MICLVVKEKISGQFVKTDSRLTADLDEAFVISCATYGVEATKKSWNHLYPLEQYDFVVIE